MLRTIGKTNWTISIDNLAISPFFCKQKTFLYFKIIDMRICRVLWVFSIFFMVSCSMENDSVKTVDLTKLDWKFRQVGTGKWFNARVPGNVISDLLYHGEIPDPFYRFNEDSVQWIEREDWEFQAFFKVGAKIAAYKNKNILFEGLDTYADVYLNDSLILQSDNMLHAWGKDISGILKEGENKLYVYFHSPVKIQDKRHEELGYIPVNTNEINPENEKKRSFSRKAPFHFGWDWGPRLVTTGIWRPVKITCANQAVLEDVYFRPLHVSTDSAVYSFEPEVKNYTQAFDGKLVYRVNGEVVKEEAVQLPVGNKRLTSEIFFQDPDLWWCHGYGEPYLYDIEVALERDGKVIDTFTDRLGIREVKLVQEPDEIGRTFYFQLNGKPVFAKGANYIPMHTLTTEVSRSMYERLMEDALQANMNMLRVWGGAIYEEDMFYDLCDEKGILIWQDFMFACEMMPPVEYMYESIRREAEYNVKRLRNHPSIVLWCGNNENLVAWETWSWKTRYSKDIVQELDKGFQKVFYEILPAAVEKYQPELSYWPSSPASYPGDILPDRKSGDEHDWSIWFGQEPFENYGKPAPRFASEYGIQAYAPMATIDSFAREGDKKYKSTVMEHRQRSKMDWIAPGFNGNDMMKRYIERYFHAPVDFDSHVYLSQIMQALALKTGIEAHRGAPRCMGSLYWQINDCWPATSWATVDYYGRWKAAHYAVKKAFKEFLAVPFLEGKNLRLDMASDYLQEKNIQVKAYSFPLLEKGNTTPLATRKGSVGALTRESWVLKGIHDGSNEKGYYVEILDGQNNTLATNIVLPRRMKHYSLEKPVIKTNRKNGEGSICLQFISDRFARGVKIQANTEGEYSDNYIDLVPGVEQEVEFIPGKGAGLQDIDFTLSSYADYIR